MRIQMHTVHFDADAKLLGYVQRKLNKLDTFYDRITGGEVFLKLDKGENSKVKNKVIEIKIHIPGRELFVKETGTSFEEVTDLGLEALKIQIKKYKEKKNTTRSPKAPISDTDDELDEAA
jgi:putative sigma-54 modulation protein